MSRRRLRRDHGLAEREAMLQCSKLVHSYLPAVELADYEHAVVREQLDAHAEVKALRDRLAEQGKPWPAVLNELRAWQESAGERFGNPRPGDGAVDDPARALLRVDAEAK